MSYISNIKLVNHIYQLIMSLSVFIKFNPIKMAVSVVWFIRSYNFFIKIGVNENFVKSRWYPCLLDNTESTPLEPTYFYQDSWAAKKIFELKPKHHYDIGSSAKTMAILSQYTPVTMIDIRPIELSLDNLHFTKGSILDLPFADESIETLSSLCVVEHIGLGRYGDPIDPFGSEKAISELKRVVKVSGVIIFSVPVDAVNTVYFNAHRAFTRDYIVSLFAGFELLEEMYQYGTNLIDRYDESKGFGTGFFMFKKGY